jgi:ketosteroid isomerase-like protein
MGRRQLEGIIMATRTPEEVFAHHGQALGGEDLEGILADYTDDAILIVQGKVYRGKDGARQVFTQLLSDVPQAAWDLGTVFADDVLYLEWKATGGGRKVEDGIDTFVFQDGMIRVQTVVYTVQPA